MAQRPSVYDYDNYRDFLRDTTDFLRTNSGFSLRSFSEKSGIKSPSFLGMVISGQRGLTAESLTKIGLGLGLSKPEFKFFEALVHFNQSKDFDEKERWYREMMSSKAFSERRVIERAEFEYFSKWYVIAVFVALGTPWRSLSMEEKASALRLKPENIEEAFAILSRLGLIEKQGKLWAPTEKQLSTTAEVEGIHFLNYHRQMIGQALDRVMNSDGSDQMLAAATISVKKKDVPRLKEKVFQVVDEVNRSFSATNDEGEEVYQINAQAFPLFDVEKEKTETSEE